MIIMKKRIKNFLFSLFKKREKFEEFIVEKISGKPFKYGGKYGTVIGEEDSEFEPGKRVYIIKEDGSRVAKDRCRRVDKKK